MMMSISSVPTPRAHCARSPFSRRFWPLRLWTAIVFCLSLFSAPCLAGPDSLTSFDLVRSEDGYYLNFATSFELSPAVEAALQKGVALNFVVEAEVFRERWYWRDQKVSRVTKAWRLTYQPLTRQYRVSFGGTQMGFDQLSDALAVIQRVSQWKIAEAADVSPSGAHYLHFSYQLDTSLLPRPVQIGVGGQPDWSLVIQKNQRLPSLTTPLD